MTPEERAELDRLLDLREREELMARVPTDIFGAMSPAERAEMRELVDDMEAQCAAVRERRARLAPDAEWIEEN